MTLEQMRKGLTPETNPAEQGEGPTLQETLTWLRETLPLGLVQYVYHDNQLAGDITSTIQAKAWSVDSCTVTVGLELTLGRLLFVTVRNTFSLGSLQGGLVSRSGYEDNTKSSFVSGDRWTYAVNLTAKSLDIIQYQSFADPELNPPISKRVDRVVVSFVEEALAKRVNGAFLHAASLCRDKQGPF
jgi:hypothetical protein